MIYPEVGPVFSGSTSFLCAASRLESDQIQKYVCGLDRIPYTIRKIFVVVTGGADSVADEASFVTDEVSFVADEVSFVADKVSFVADEASFVADEASFVADEASSELILCL